MDDALNDIVVAADIPGSSEICVPFNNRTDIGNIAILPSDEYSPRLSHFLIFRDVTWDISII